MIVIVDQWKGMKGKWNQDYVNGLTEVFDRRGIEYSVESSNFENELVKTLLNVPANSIVWFMTYDNGMAEIVRKNRPDLFLVAHAHGTKTMLFEPSFIHGAEIFREPAEEIESRLISNYDIVFCNSEYQKSFIPEKVKAKVFVSGFPVPVSGFENKTQDLNYYKEEKTVVISQRFSFEKNLPFAIMMGQELVKNGYSVVWCYGARTGDFTMMSDYVKVAEQAGIRFRECPTKIKYYEEICKAEYVLTTSAYDTLSLSMVEGYLAGCKVIAPRLMCFPEYMKEENMYDAFSIRKCIKAFETAEVNGFKNNKLWDNEEVVDNMLLALEGVKAW